LHSNQLISSNVTQLRCWTDDFVKKICLERSLWTRDTKLIDWFHLFSLLGGSKTKIIQIYASGLYPCSMIDWEVQFSHLLGGSRQKKIQAEQRAFDFFFC
jgi:hypothetical protein